MKISVVLLSLVFLSACSQYPSEKSTQITVSTPNASTQIADAQCAGNAELPPELADKFIEVSEPKLLDQAMGKLSIKFEVRQY